VEIEGEGFKGEGIPMNWRRGFFRVWIVGSLAWMALVVSIGVATDHVVLKKPDISVHWGKEDIIYSSASTEEEIKSDLKRRADKMDADDEVKFQNLTQEQKDFCDQNKNTNFDQLPQYCQTYAFHGSLFVIPEGWEDQVRFPTRTIPQEAFHLTPWMVGPPALLLLIGWVFVWILRGFRLGR